MAELEKKGWSKSNGRSRPRSSDVHSRQGPRQSELRMQLYRRGAGTHKVPKEGLFRRFHLLTQGSWTDLMYPAEPQLNQHQVAPFVNDDHQRAEAACRKVQLGEVPRARQQVLTQHSLGCSPHGRRSFFGGSPGTCLDFVPESPLEVDFKIFVKSLKSVLQGVHRQGIMGARTSTSRLCWTMWTLWTCGPGGSPRRDHGRHSWSSTHSTGEA